MIHWHSFKNLPRRFYYCAEKKNTFHFWKSSCWMWSFINTLFYLTKMFMRTIAFICRRYLVLLSPNNNRKKYIFGWMVHTQSSEPIVLESKTCPLPLSKNAWLNQGKGKNHWIIREKCTCSIWSIDVKVLPKDNFQFNSTAALKRWLDMKICFFMSVQLPNTFKYWYKNIRNPTLGLIS